MRDINRIEPFLNKFQKLWLQNPNLRFSQLVTILLEMTKHDDIFSIEEYEWSIAINKYMKNERR